MPLLPSPKSQLKDKISSTSASLEADASNATSNGAVPVVGVAVKEATGGVFTDGAVTPHSKLITCASALFASLSSTVISTLNGLFTAAPALIVPVIKPVPLSIANPVGKPVA